MRAMEKFFDGKVPFFFGDKWFLYNEPEKKWEIQGWGKSIKNKAKKTNLVVCTANLGYELYNVLYYASLSGFNVILIYISAQELTNEKDPEAMDIINDLPRIGATVYRINISDEIKSVLEVAV